MRKAVSITAALFAALMAYDALTVPQFAMTGPTLATIALAAVAYLAWPKRRKAAVDV
jgi:hypothetical protein